MNALRTSQFLLLLTLSAALGSGNGEKDGDNATWSQPVNGLRARLSVLRPLKADDRFCRVFIEFENVGNTLGAKRIRFDRDKLLVWVANDRGEKLPVGGQLYSGLSPSEWETIPLPYAGTVRFQISFPGLYPREKEMLIVDVGSRSAWVIPQDGSPYYLSGRFAIPEKPGDHPNSDWSGILELPRVEIPKKR